MAPDFDHARMQMQDLLLRDDNLSSTERLVGILLLGYVNRVSGDAWPANKTMAADLGVSLRIVKYATAKLEQLGYFRIERNVRGGSNHYFPCFERCANFAPLSGEERSAENATEGCKKERGKGAENVPQSPLKNSLRTPSTESALLTNPISAAAGIHRQQGSDLHSRKGDEQVERQLSEELGPDGDEILGALHSINGGEPYYRLIAAARHGEVSQRDLYAARLVIPNRFPP
jgi:hypothetical protein